MKKTMNLYEWIFVPFISYVGFFSKMKWLSLTCFIFVASIVPVLFWTEKFRKDASVKEGSILNLVGSLVLFGIESVLIWGYLKLGPFNG
jgi:hypothetical protein